MKYLKAHTIVTKNRKGSWFGYEYNMNIYRGCSHGCIYCDSRYSSYGVDDFCQIRVKEDALRIIRDDLRHKNEKGVICSGAMSDPYNPLEKEMNLTHNALELINAFGFGVGLITKSPLIVRDIPIIKDIQNHSPVIVSFSFSTMDDDLAKKIEPNAPLPSERLRALRKLAQEGVFAGVLLMPVLPFIGDHEENIREVVRCTAKAGAAFLYPRMGVTLRGNQREYYYNQLDRIYPGLRKEYERIYGDKRFCNSKHIRRLMKILREECRENNILFNMEDIISVSRFGYSI